MGAVLAKFRKQKTTAEILENLEGRIQELEKRTLNTREQQRRFVFQFMAIAVGLYVVAFFVFYFVYFPPTWKERIVNSWPLIVFPLVIMMLRKLLTWYFQRKLNKDFDQLSSLKAEKKEILEQVMDKETYKVAVNLLQRYGDKNSIPKATTSATSLMVATPRNPKYNSPLLAPMTRSYLTPGGVGSLNNNNLRTLGSTQSASNMRALQNPAQTPTTLRQWNTDQTPRTVIAPSTPSGTSAMMRAGQQQQLQQQQQLRRRTPFPVINQQGKSVFERIVDVLIGDGPGDRFAMICKVCYAHNGMAPAEEFEYVTFRCAFCNALNPARKERPVAPPLDMGPASLGSLQANEENEDSSSTSSDSESETIAGDGSGVGGDDGAQTESAQEGASARERQDSGTSDDFEQVKPAEVDREEATVAEADSYADADATEPPTKLLAENKSEAGAAAAAQGYEPPLSAEQLNELKKEK